MATDDDDAATLRERVRELEATVAQQQDTIQQLLPSRRAVLAGGAGLVGGAALTGQASAQSAAGQIGTSSEPVDVEAATVTANSVNTDLLDSRGGYDDVTSSRDFDTLNQNSSGADMNVAVVITPTADNTRMNVEARVGASSPPNFTVQQEEDTRDRFEQISIYFTIPNGHYYNLIAAGDTADYTIKSWGEQT